MPSFIFIIQRYVPAAYILANLGQVHAVLNNSQKARERYSESLKLLEEGGAAGEDSLIDHYINERDDAISHYIDACVGAAGILNEIDGASRYVRAAQLYERAVDFAERIAGKKESEHTYLRLMICLQKAMEASPRVYKAFHTNVSDGLVEVARILYQLTGNSDYKDYGKSLKKWRLVKKVGMKFIDFTGL